MEFQECLFGRRSIRNFSDEDVSIDTINEIITAGVYAPSACNYQAWKFILLGKESTQKSVFTSKVAARAPYGILVVYRNDIYVSGRVRGDYIQSAAAAIQNMLLYINYLGLGGVWICNLPEDDKLRETFSIPSNFDVIGYVAFGHPRKGNENSQQAIEYHYGDRASFEAHKRRYTLEQVLCMNEFTQVEGDCTFAKYREKPTLLQRIAKKIKPQRR